MITLMFYKNLLITDYSGSNALELTPPFLLIPDIILLWSPLN